MGHSAIHRKTLEIQMNIAGMSAKVVIFSGKAINNSKTALCHILSNFLCFIVDIVVPLHVSAASLEYIIIWWFSIVALHIRSIIASCPLDSWKVSAICASTE